MSELTPNQKAQAFDALVEWLECQGKEERKKSDDHWAAKRDVLASHSQGKADAYDRAFEISKEIALRQPESQPEQAENMPPPDLDLSKHVGQTAVLWCGGTGIISENPFSPECPYRVAHFDYTKDGFFDDRAENVHNIKTILP